MTAPDGSGTALPDGYPTLREMERVLREPTFREMESFSNEFLRANERCLSDYARRWVADPLNHWSRRWEYSFVYQGLADTERPQHVGPQNFLDAGAGLTFFPHFLVSRQIADSVVCVDRDPAIERDSQGLSAPASDQVRYLTSSLATLPAPPASVDGIYCISVLEHCDSHDVIAEEFARVLRPSGRLIVTIDISFDGTAEMSPNDGVALIATLDRFFIPDNDYATMLNRANLSETLNTGTIREREPALLPWQKPGLLASTRHLIRTGRLPQRPFSLLTCFCMSWTRR